MTIRKFPAAIAILLMAVLMLASCNLGGNAGNSSPEAAATVAVRAMTQAVDSVGQTNGVSVSGNVYKMTSFKADDGTVINGTFEIDGSGNIVDAELELNIDSRVLYFVLSDGNGTDPPCLYPYRRKKQRERIYRGNLRPRAAVREGRNAAVRGMPFLPAGPVGEPSRYHPRDA